MRFKSIQHVMYGSSSLFFFVLPLSLPPIIMLLLTVFLTSQRKYSLNAIGVIIYTIYIICGPGSSVGIATGRSGIESRWGRDFPPDIIYIYIYEIWFCSLFNISLRWKWLVNATPRPLYRRERSCTHCTGDWVWTAMENRSPNGIRFPKPQPVSVTIPSYTISINHS